MKACKLERIYHLGILLLLGFLSSCSGNNSQTTDGTTAITFRLNFARSVDRSLQSPVDHAVGEPDICKDYLIDTITVQVYRTADDTEVASVQEACAAHSLSVSNVPVAELLYVVCKGNAGPLKSWQGQMDDVVTAAGEATDIGTIDMTYIGDDTAAPEVASTYPAADAVDVDLKSSLAVMFNEALAPGSISDNAITVTADHKPVPGQVRYDQGLRTISFTPADDVSLDAHTNYTVTLNSHSDDTGWITDIAGNRLPGDATWQFTTRGTNDTVAPQIIATSPADNATGFKLLTPISVLFNEPMDAASLTEGVFQLSTGQGPVSGQIAYDAQTRMLAFTPDTDLAAITLHTALITTEAKDTAQNALEAPHTWEFTTIGPLRILTVSKTGSGGGTVNSSPSYIDCGETCEVELNAGTLVTLNANAVGNSEFAGWSGDICSEETETCAFTIMDDTTVSANFALRTYTITTSITPDSGDGGAIDPPSATVIHGGNIEFTIQANPYHHLAELIVDGNSVTSASSYRFENVSEDHTLRAIFDGNEKNISENATSNGVLPQINAEGHVVWAGKKGADWEIYYDDESNKTNISDEPTRVDYMPQINTDGHVVWASKKGEDWEIYYDDGSSKINISNNPSCDDQFPEININGDVVWICDDGTNDVIYYYDRSAKTATPISENPDGNQNGNYTYLKINEDGDTVWCGTDVSNPESEIFYYSRSSQAVKNISKSPQDLGGEHFYPEINLDGHVVWQNLTDSVYTIYYYDGHEATDIPKDTNLSYAYPKINDDGHVVWSCRNDSNNDICYYDGKEISYLGYDGFNMEINSEGQVVWWSKTEPGYAIYVYEDKAKRVNKIYHDPDIELGPDEDSFWPQINPDGLVVWSNFDGSDWEIYLSNP